MLNRNSSAGTAADSSTQPMLQCPAKLLPNTMLAAVNLSNVSPNDKICIVVFGNIASGKSTLSKKIIELLPQFSFACIDNNRRNLFGKIENSIERERKAEEELIKQIFSRQYVVYETTGTSRLFKSIQFRIRSHFKTIFIFVNCSVSECVYRFNYRKNDRMAMPGFKSKLSIREVMYSIEDKMNRKVHLELNSEKLNQDEMFDQFKAAFYRR